MSRNLNPKCKICRRLGESICNRGVKCALRRRQYPPGIHGPKGYPRLTGFGQQLKEKQKARFLYGITERQFSNYYTKAIKSEGDTGQKLLELLECRLDNVMFRIHAARSRSQARQLVSHGHVIVNGKRMDVPSYSVRPGDVISIKKQAKSIPFITETVKQSLEIPDWISFDAEKVLATVVRLPAPDEQILGVQTKLIVEYYSR